MSLIWFKNQIVPRDNALVPVLSPTAQFGLNVFEGIRGYKSSHGKVYLFRLNCHLTRLQQSCKLIGIRCPYSPEFILQALRQVLHANSFDSDLAVRITIFVDGFGSWSSSEPVDMFIAPVPRPRNRLDASSGVTACTSTWRRIDDMSLPPRIKAGANYINSRYAHLEAQSLGNIIPILLNSNGSVAEGAGACLMIVRSGVLITPPSTDSILDSITRDSLLRISLKLSIPHEVRHIDRTELYLADEAFLCGSAAEITPITRVDRFTVGDGAPGKITCLLSQAFFDIADHSNPSFRHWLTPV